MSGGHGRLARRGQMLCLWRNPITTHTPLRLCRTRIESHVRYEAFAGCSAVIRRVPCIWSLVLPEREVTSPPNGGPGGNDVPTTKTELQPAIFSI